MKYAITLLLTAFSYCGYAQEHEGHDHKEAPSSVKVYRWVDVMPEPGYDIAAFVKKQLNPAEAGNFQAQVQVIILADGSVTDPVLINSGRMPYPQGQEALRIARLLPKWKPGMEQSMPVKVYQNINIDLRK